jgi:hypothetical protein
MTASRRSGADGAKDGDGNKEATPSGPEGAPAPPPLAPTGSGKVSGLYFVCCTLHAIRWPGKGNNRDDFCWSSRLNLNHNQSL